MSANAFKEAFLKHFPTATKFFLASPYSHHKKSVRVARAKHAAKLAGQIMGYGFAVYCPIAHGHAIAEVASVPLDYTGWVKINRAILSACDVICIAKMDGWEQSEGIKKEIEMAIEFKKPIVFLPLDRYGKIETQIKLDARGYKKIKEEQFKEKK